MRKILFLTAIIIVSQFSLNAQPVSCSLTLVSDTLFIGTCGIGDSLLFTIQLKPASTQNTSTLYGKGTRKGRSENLPLFLEIKNDTGILGTSFFVNSWYKVRDLKLSEKKIEFTYNSNSLGPPTEVNLTILRELKKYFTDSTKWNRDDKRVSGRSDCQPNTQKRTLFCAIYYASADIMGDFYAGPSFQGILDAVKRVIKGAQHPIQSFNNDPKTTFADLHAVINDAINTMEKEIKIRK
ncbi:MAG TPA: hypothetical protein VGP43_11980 [Chitinophagaceae bacterium]|nr:hypothetical protein [Chitinophagaceae bacterium]